MGGKKLGLRGGGKRKGLGNHTPPAYCHPFQTVSKQPNLKFVTISLNLNPHETSPHVNASNQQISFVASISVKPTIFCTIFKSKKPMQRAQQKVFYLQCGRFYQCM